MSKWIPCILVPLIVATACHPATQSTGVTSAPDRQQKVRDGIELAAEVMIDEDGRYESALTSLTEQVKNGDPAAEQAYAEIVLRWHRRPDDQGTPNVPLIEAWDLYRRAATKSQPAFSWLRAYYINGAPGLPRNNAVAKCMLNVFMQKLPLAKATSCYSLSKDT